MNLKEKVKGLKIDYKFVTTTSLLLIVIVFEIAGCFRTYGGKKKSKEVVSDSRRAIREINGRNSIFARMRENINKFEMSGFTFSERTRIEDQNYIIDLKVPKELNKDDVKISLNKDVLIVSFVVKTEKRIKGGQSIHLVDFTKDYQLPPNNASLSDITYNIGNGRILRITVPILKQN
ncbi:MAG: Hsp20/alpha crystallin family protein [Rickettsiales bacterium]|jgi:HSP20 family molecular chaperone IbpA|nr:Hsp20/alpha crystallin family protein [Rickettsiales bacterium]